MSEKTSKKLKSLKRKTMTGNIITYVILAIISVVWLIPFIMIVLESFRCETTMQVGYVFPKEWGLRNYQVLFSGQSEVVKYPRWYVNTLIIAIAVAVIQPIMVLCVSYTLSRTRFASRKLLMNAMLVIGMFPGFLSMIILYKVLSGMGLTGTGAIWGLILV